MNTGLKLILTSCILLAGCKEQILHDLSEGEANRYLTQLYEAGIEGEKKMQPDGSWALSVKSSQTMPALVELSSARLFRRARPETANPSSGSMIPSRDAQRFQYERAISQEVEVTLESLSGVLEARVHLNLPTIDPLLGSKNANGSQPSGSVLIISADAFHEDTTDIAKLVSGASGVDASKISVLITPINPKENNAKTEAISLNSDLVEDSVDKIQINEPSFTTYGPLTKKESEALFENKKIVSKKIAENKNTTTNNSISHNFSFNYLFASLLLLVLGIGALRYLKKDKIVIKKRRISKDEADFATKIEAISNGL